MRSAHHDALPQMADVLFHVHRAHYDPRPRHFIFAILCVWVVIMDFVLETIRASSLASPGHMRKHMQVHSEPRLINYMIQLSVTALPLRMGF